MTQRSTPARSTPPAVAGRTTRSRGSIGERRYALDMDESRHISLLDGADLQRYGIGWNGWLLMVGVAGLVPAELLPAARWNFEPLWRIFSYVGLKSSQRFLGHPAGCESHRAKKEN